MMHFERWVKILFKSWFQSANFVAKVISVDKEYDTCVVEEQDRPRKFDVRLTSTVAGYDSRFVVYPKLGSFVTCGVRDNLANEAFVIQYGEVEEINASIQGFNMVLNAQGITFNGGDLGGMAIVPELTAQLAKLSRRVDVIRDVLTTGANGAGNVVFSGMSQPGYLNAMADPERFNNIENEKVKH